MPVQLSCPKCNANNLGDDTFCASCGARMSPGDTSVAPDLLLERLRRVTLGVYDVHSELGRGGMAVVYLAYDLQLQRQVAIKVMLPELMLSAGMAERFMLEARTAARLSHPNIVIIHVVPPVSHEDPLHYFVMALVEGATLEDVLRRDRQLSIDEVRWIISQGARALQYAHARGVVHRDVKPANILIDARGEVVLSDFGIAKAAESPTLTRTGTAVGTPSYMSPEQVMATDVSGASDQYSLGIVAYELLGGQVPFNGSAVMVQWAHAHTPAPSLQELAPKVPAALTDAVMRMLAKSPAERWPSLDEVGEMFTADLRGGGSAARAALGRRAGALQAMRSSSLGPTPQSPVPQTTSRPIPRELSAPLRPVPPPSSLAPLAEATPAPAMDDPPHELVMGEVFSLGVESEGGLSGAVRFHSTDSSVVVVDAAGNVTARNAGTAAVVITADDTVVRVPIVVRVPRRLIATAVAVEPARLQVTVRSTVTLGITVRDQYGDIMRDAAIRTETDDRGIAVVSPEGVVRGVSIGTTSVRVMCEGVAATVAVAVEAAAVASMTFNPSSLSLDAGDSARVRVTLADEHGVGLEGRTVRWESSAPQVASVDAAGRVVGHVAGEARISATAGLMTQSIAVRVASVPVAMLYADEVAVSLWTGRARAVNLEATDTKGRPVSAAAARWTSSDPSVAAVANGTIQALRAGQTVIVAELDRARVEIEVRVTEAPIAGLTPALPSVSIQERKTFALRVAAVAPDGGAAASVPVQWQSSDPSIASVDNVGTVRALAAGAATITMSTGTHRAVTTVNVTARNRFNPAFIIGIGAIAATVAVFAWSAFRPGRDALKPELGTAPSAGGAAVGSAAGNAAGSAAASGDGDASGATPLVDSPSVSAADAAALAKAKATEAATAKAAASKAKEAEAAALAKAKEAEAAALAKAKVAEAAALAKAKATEIAVAKAKAAEAAALAKAKGTSGATGTPTTLPGAGKGTPAVAEAAKPKELPPVALPPVTVPQPLKVDTEPGPQRNLPATKASTYTMDGAQKVVRDWLATGNGGLPASMNSGDFKLIAEILKQNPTPTPVIGLSELTDESVVVSMAYLARRPSRAMRFVRTRFRFFLQSRRVELIGKPAWDNS